MKIKVLNLDLGEQMVKLLFWKKCVLVPKEINFYSSYNQNMHQIELFKLSETKLKTKSVKYTKKEKLTLQVSIQVKNEKFIL